MQRRFIALLALLGLGVLRADVIVTTLPLQWVCETLCGPDLRVRGYNPDSGQDAPDFASADLVVLNGAGFEAWADALQAPNLFRSSEAVAEAYSEARKLDEHARALFPIHTRSITWLDPLHLRLQARAIAERLAPQIPREALAERLQIIETALDALEKELRAHPRLKREAFIALHPALEGLSPGYGWIVRSAPEAPADFAAFYETYPARLAIALGEPDPATASVLQDEYRIHTFAFDAGTRPVAKDADWPALMRRNFTTLSSAFLP